MEQRYSKRMHDQRTQQGFTLTEVVVVVALAAILAGLALPPFIQWLKNAEYRASARNILSILRETKSKAITSNREHRVEFESVNRRYRVTRGDRANNSSDWSTVVYDWTILPPQVHMHANVEKIHMNTNGTSNAGTIKIQDAAAVKKYEVIVASTGRIRIP
jgi:prepilin-type N-terminal cleavage/methylation domain-containing protein